MVDGGVRGFLKPHDESRISETEKNFSGPRKGVKEVEVQSWA